jgi:hypothetical protein
MSGPVTLKAWRLAPDLSTFLPQCGFRRVCFRLTCPGGQSIREMGRLGSGANLGLVIASYPKRTGIHALFAVQSPP